jgi:hypothetical protein
MVDADAVVSDQLPLERCDEALQRLRRGVGRKLLIAPARSR